MRLAELVSSLSGCRVTGAADPEILSLAYDSRQVRPGALFFALSGAATDGNRFVKQAVQSGAAAVLSELAPPPAPYALTRTGAPGTPVSWIEVPDALAAMSRVSAAFFGRPSSKLEVVGITGTNGKTTTSYLLESILHHCGRPCGVLGTVNYRVRGRPVEKAPNTTPASLDVHRLLELMRLEGCADAVMEVSSHALSLRRVDDVEFDAAVLTNFHRDHLDFHKTREAYLEAKARLFDLLARLDSSKKRRLAVLNRDDPSFAAFQRRAQGARVLGFGLGPEADVRAADVAMSLQGSMFRLLHGGRALAARLPLIGRHNVYNALAAAAVGFGLGLPEDGVLEGLSRLSGVPGRLEPVGSGTPFHVFVDYAHTDSALASALETIRQLPHRRILTVFGCGGDRDRTKRAPMGKAAAELSDEVFLADDNPRGEDPRSILREIEEGIKTAGRQNYKMIPDRAEAIAQAIALAREGDVVLIAGKGHEDYQIVGGKTLHFDDREEALKALKARSLA